MTGNQRTVQYSEQWHLDKRVPIALILTILIQSAAAIWWAAGMTERMNHFEQRQAGVDGRNRMADELLSLQGQKVAVLSEAVANTNRNIERLQGELASTNALLREFLLQHNGVNHEASEPRR